VIRILLAGAWLQFMHMRRSLEDLMVLVTLPLFTIAFLAIFLEGGRRDLVPYAIVGTSIMAVWGSALFVSGEVIAIERWGATLEPTSATPAPLALVIVGRIATVTVVSLLGLVEGIVVALVVFRIGVQVPHPGVFAATVAVTAFAMVGTSTLLAALFVIARSALIFQNSLSYPFYILGGAVVPVALLPVWIRPVSRIVFLSWSSDLLRASLLPPPPADVGWRLGVIALLGGAGFGLGLWLIHRVVDRLRVLGTMSYS
jgi:ABC-2 type transport system permease protein